MIIGQWKTDQPDADALGVLYVMCRRFVEEVSPQSVDAAVLVIDGKLCCCEDVFMKFRRFGRLGFNVSAVGYGMWGIAGGEGGWTGACDESGQHALQNAVDLGCNFFDTAWIYGRGHSEAMLGQLCRANPEKKLYVATKVPPKNRQWPSKRGDRLIDTYPEDYIYEYVEKSLKCLGLDHIDLLQFHTWEDDWHADSSWVRAVRSLRESGQILGVGISINRWEPENSLRTLETGLVDAVQVIYNIFDQAPEDKLFPACAKNDIAVIARVPFDEGSLTGTLNASTKWPHGDWRNSYFVPENLIPTLARVERLRAVLGNTAMSEAALRFILANPQVSTVIPGMRSTGHVAANLATADMPPLPAALLDALYEQRWDREPKWWSQ